MKAYVYILTNKKRKQLYIGVTSDLNNRISEHKTGLKSQWCRNYGVDVLIYYETHVSMSRAIQREKQLKNWHKEWKWNLIAYKNSALEEIFPGDWD